MAPSTRGTHSFRSNSRKGRDRNRLTAKNKVQASSKRIMHPIIKRIRESCNSTQPQLKTNNHQASRARQGSSTHSRWLIKSKHRNRYLNKSNSWEVNKMPTRAMFKIPQGCNIYNKLTKGKVRLKMNQRWNSQNLSHLNRNNMRKWMNQLSHINNKKMETKTNRRMKTIMLIKFKKVKTFISKLSKKKITKMIINLKTVNRAERQR